MGDVRQPGSGAVLADSGSRPASPVRTSLLFKVVYSVGSGALATVAGAGASLVVATADRVAVWCAVAGTASVGAGLIWHSSLASGYREAVSRWRAAASSS
jgi:hypothetical protein